MKLNSSITLIATALAIGAWVCVGCGPKNPPAQASQWEAIKLPGTADIKAALEKKDYDGAVAAYLRIKQTVSTEEQHVQAIALSRELRLKLGEAATTDPKAAEALTAIGALTTGR